MKSKQENLDGETKRLKDIEFVLKAKLDNALQERDNLMKNSQGVDSRVQEAEKKVKEVEDQLQARQAELKKSITQKENELNQSK